MIDADRPTPITVSARAHRKLRDLARYRGLADLGRLGSEALGLGPGEVAIGIYENPSGSRIVSLVITDRGLHIFEADDSRFLSFEEMMTIDLEKGEDLPIIVGMRDGETVAVPIMGGNPEIGTRDAFAVRMFLDGVVGDLHRRRDRSIAVSAAIGEQEAV